MLRIIVVVLLLAAPARASVTPTVELGLEFQDVPGSLALLAPVRGGICIACEKNLAPFARVGAGYAGTGSEVVIDPAYNGVAVDGAIGARFQTCPRAAVYVGVSVGWGMQYMRYAPRPPDSFDTEPRDLTSAFVELRPFIARGRFSFAIEVRIHRLVPLQHKPTREAGGIVLAWQFE